MNTASHYRLDDGTVVSFEVDPETAGYQNAGPSDRVIEGIKKATAPAVRAAKEVLDLVRAEAKPQEAEVTFAVKVNGTMDWLVAKSATEGSFQVRLMWTSAAPVEGGGTLPSPDTRPAA